MHLLDGSIPGTADLRGLRNGAAMWAGWVPRQVQHLDRAEAVLGQNEAGPRLWMALRSAESRMIVERLCRVLEKMQPKTFPTSLLGDAIDFARGPWILIQFSHS